MISVKISCFSVLVLFNCLVQGQNISDGSSSTHLSTTTVSACPGGHINPPACTICSKVSNVSCVPVKSENKPSRSTGWRIAVIFFACVFTVILLVVLLSIYGRLNQQRRRRLSSNLGNITGSPELRPTTNNRWNNFLRTIGLNRFNKHGRLNFFSISNNDSALGSYRQPDTSQSHLNDNLDEALLFDDPYADGGFHQTSANPYRTLTLSVT